MTGEINEIAQLVLRERQGRDRGWWAQMRASYHEDSSVRLSWFDGSGYDFTTQSEIMFNSGNRPVHRASPPVIHENGGRAVIELPTAIQARLQVDGVEADLISYSRLLFRAERRQAVWRIYSLDAIYESDMLIPSIPGKIFAIDQDILASFRPSYRLIGYHLNMMGKSISNDLFGDDRPEEVAKLYRSCFGWAEIRDGGA